MQKTKKSRKTKKRKAAKKLAPHYKVLMVALVIVLAAAAYYLLVSSNPNPANTQSQNSSGTQNFSGVAISRITIQVNRNGTFNRIITEPVALNLSLGQVFSLNGTIYDNYSQICSIQPYFLPPFILVSSDPAVPITVYGQPNLTFEIPIKFQVKAPETSYNGGLIEDLYFNC